MASTTFTTLLIALGVLAALSGGYGKDVIVGGDQQWTIDPTFNYSEWAMQTTVAVGDNLIFKYNSTDHNVRSVTAAQYESCDTTSYIQQWETGDDSVVINSTSTYYFLCSKPGHCLYQKFSIAVPAGSADSPPQAETPNASNSLLPRLGGVLPLSVLVLLSAGFL
ncbi:hypothetical protein MPTK1_3g09420 [Marchantia polymorpha subsp. ruderalis]|uniref:Phytocyanin domain-containing protein n=2 Tax=Marchantia polymorpha TaxID=3197 RepID=A0AAF6AZ15_MARPO|nr:hypothetical protein MARPO_0085s0085 [Marchantia polymorpha]BBN04999.1 hypothetical protein Mp_3g09420 [Marchantia polymorpha subsp. ruderalis]|eukprot:PTQ33877.1 hypothetical protein MARPO_0085s0085 [Marchantia polymorpha]